MHTSRLLVALIVWASSYGKPKDANHRDITVRIDCTFYPSIDAVLLSMGKFIMSKRSNGNFQFNLLAANSQVILKSEAYSSKPNCENGIESVKKNATKDSMYDRKNSSNGKYYFNLKATNGQVIGTSEIYEAKSGM